MIKELCILPKKMKSTEKSKDTPFKKVDGKRQRKTNQKYPTYKYDGYDFNGFYDNFNVL